MKILRNIVIIACVLTLSACGFKMRGEANLSAALQRVHVQSADPFSPLKRDLDAALARSGAKVEDKSGDVRGQFKAHVRNFLDCVKSRQTPVSDPESAHRVATVCHLANISLRLGRRLRWDAAREEILDDAEASRMLVRPYRAPWDQELKSLNVG